jgi:hypothetical protein
MRPHPKQGALNLFTTSIRDSLQNAADALERAAHALHDLDPIAGHEAMDAAQDARAVLQNGLDPQN